MKGPAMGIERGNIKERTIIKGGNKRRKEENKRILISSTRSLISHGKRQVASQVTDRCLGGWWCHSYTWGNRFDSEEDEPIVGHTESEGSVDRSIW